MRPYYLLANLPLGALGALGACNLATLDPEALVVERTPIGAVDCGQSNLWADLPPLPVRARVLASVAAGRPFFAIVDEAGHRQRVGRVDRVRRARAARRVLPDPHS